MSLTIASPLAVHNTFVMERHFPASPQRVFQAFSNPTQKRRWFSEGGGQEIEKFTMDFQVGGHEVARSRMKTGPMQGVVFTHQGIYLDLVPDCRIVTASTMSLGDQRISASLATFELLPDGSGTKLIFTHQTAFLEGADGPQMREAGWKKLLENLSAEFAPQTA